MKIYINNEEVVCSQKMTIKESLKNTSSVILNNVYPKSWETDKDYVSRFYMPKDYSHCKIVDETKTGTHYESISNNIRNLYNKYVDYQTNKIIYSKLATSYRAKVIPGKRYAVYITKAAGQNMYLYEADSLDTGTEVTPLTEITSTGYVYVTPTKKYILCTYIYNNTAYLYMNSLYVYVPNGLVFSGIVKNSGNINLNPRYPHYATLQLLDYKTFLSEGDTLNYVLESQYVGYAIREIVDNLDGFYVGKINLPSTVMAAYNCNEKTAYDVFEYISEITNSIWYTKAISDDIVTINFCSNDKLTTADTIEYTQEYFTEHNIEDIKYSYSANDYRNKQVIVNDEATANILQVENLTYEGESLQTLYPISSISSITSGTKSYSFSNEKAKSIGQYANFYYSYNSNKIEVNTGIGTGTVLTVSYYPIVSTRQTAYNETEIERIAQTGRNGTIARYEKRTDTNDEKALSQIAQTYLDYKGVPEITLTIKSYYKDILNVGEKVFFNGPLEDLKTNYLVTDKQIEMTTTGDQQVIFYTYKLSSSFNDEGSINFFDNQRRKLEGNIEEGEFIPRYVDLPSSTNIIFYDLTTSEIPTPNDILDGELDIELIGEGPTNKLNAKLNFKL